MSTRPPLWPRVKAALAYLRSQEPARVQAFWKTILGLAIAAGVTVPEWVDVRVSLVIGALWLVLTFWQGEATRRRVVPADNVPPQYHADNVDASPAAFQTPP